MKIISLPLELIIIASLEDLNGPGEHSCSYDAPKFTGSGGALAPLVSPCVYLLPWWRT